MLKNGERNMSKLASKLAAVLVLMSIGFSAQAGHLFIQASSNTPIDLTAGFGITIPQEGSEGASPGTSSNIDLSNFDSGDTLVLTIGGVVRVFPFDNMPAGWGASSSSIFYLSGNDPELAALNLTVPFNFRIDATAGSFTVLGFRLRLANITVDGTGSGVVNQSGVTVTASGPATPVPIFGPWQLALVVLALIALAALGRRRLGLGHKAS
jgi:hypothetical protein